MPEGLGEKIDVLDVLLRSCGSRELLKLLLVRMRAEQSLSVQEMVGIYESIAQERVIPLSIFSGLLYPQEALCKYLREQEQLSNGQIATLLNKDIHSIWATYKRARRKKKEKFHLEQKELMIPLSWLQHEKRSILESVVYYLWQVHHLKTKEIAQHLGNSQSSVAVILKRAKEKDETRRT